MEKSRAKLAMREKVFLYRAPDSSSISLLTLFATATDAVCQSLYSYLLKDIATDLLPSRPNRHEPRVVKRRPKPFPRMKQPRAVLKAKIAA